MNTPASNSVPPGPSTSPPAQQELEQRTVSGAAALPTPKEFRWLHDALEARAMHDDLLLAQRAIYYAAIVGALIGGELLAYGYGFQGRADWGSGQAFISFLGAIVSSLWWFTIERTVAGQAVWRHALIQLEQKVSPFKRQGLLLLTEPIDQTWSGWKNPDPLNLGQPVELHNSVFHERPLASFRLSRSPNSASRLVPVASIFAWIGILVYQTWRLWITVGIPVLPLLYLCGVGFWFLYVFLSWRAEVREQLKKPKWTKYVLQK